MIYRLTCNNGEKKELTYSSPSSSSSSYALALLRWRLTGRATPLRPMLSASSSWSLEDELPGEAWRSLSLSFCCEMAGDSSSEESSPPARASSSASRSAMAKARVFLFLLPVLCSFVPASRPNEAEDTRSLWLGGGYPGVCCCLLLLCC